MDRETYNVYPFPHPENTGIIYALESVALGMDFSIQQAVLLVLGGLIPPLVFLADRAEFVVAVTLVNVLLIWASLRVATGGSFPGVGSDTADPERASSTETR